MSLCPAAFGDEAPGELPHRSYRLAPTVSRRVVEWMPSAPMTRSEEAGRFVAELNRDCALSCWLSRRTCRPIPIGTGCREMPAPGADPSGAPPDTDRPPPTVLPGRCLPAVDLGGRTDAGRGSASRARQPRTSQAKSTQRPCRVSRQVDARYRGLPTPFPARPRRARSHAYGAARAAPRPAMPAPTTEFPDWHLCFHQCRWLGCPSRS